MSDAAVELDALKLRVSLIERILLNVWASQLATTAARTKADALQLVEDRIDEYADAVRQETFSEKGSLSLFDSNLQYLKTLIPTIR